MNETALTRGVLDDPDADAPRLAFADWAAANGDPARAELIRAQIETVARRRQGRADWTDPDDVAHRLLTEHRARWLPALPTWATEPAFARGFVELVTAPAADFAASSRDLFAAAPIRHVNFTGVRPALDVLAASPALARLSAIEMWKQDLDDDDARELAGSPHLGKLRWLNLMMNRVGPAGVEALAASPGLARLAVLLLRGNLVEDPSERVVHDEDSGQILEARLPSSGVELERRHGPLPWLRPVSSCPLAILPLPYDF